MTALNELFDFIDVDSTVILGRDRNGNMLHDGCDVLSYNIFAEGEKWPLEGPKIGVPCTLRRLKKDGRIVSVVRGVDSDGRSFTSTTGVNTERDIELKKELK